MIHPAGQTATAQPYGMHSNVSIAGEQCGGGAATVHEIDLTGGTGAMPVLADPELRRELMHAARLAGIPPWRRREAVAWFLATFGGTEASRKHIN